MALFSIKNPVAGIYTLTNTINGKMYVGYTTDLYTRDKKHLSELRSNTHPNAHLQNAWNKYGESAFEFDSLEECEERFLVALEHYWLLLLRTKEDEFGYNIKETNPNSVGGRHSQKTKDKISKINKGRKRPDNKLTWGGRKHSEESKKRISESRKGKATGPHSPERKKLTADGIHKYWKNKKEVING